MNLDETLGMQYVTNMKFSQTFQRCYGLSLILKFQFFSISLEIVNGF